MPAARSKWWPLPSHTPEPARKSAFTFPKITTLQIALRTGLTDPDANTIWFQPWSIPLTHRIANAAEWSSLLEETE